MDMRTTRLFGQQLEENRVDAKSPDPPARLSLDVVKFDTVIKLHTLRSGEEDCSPSLQSQEGLNWPPKNNPGSIGLKKMTKNGSTEQNQSGSISELDFNVLKQSLVETKHENQQLKNENM